MKLIQYVTAYMALAALVKKEFPYETAYKIVSLKQRLAGKVDFYVAEEKKLVEKFAKKDADGAVVTRGAEFFYKGETDEEIGENRRAFERARAELGALDTGEEIEPITIRVPEDVRISPEAIEALDGIAVFEVIK